MAISLKKILTTVALAGALTLAGASAAQAYAIPPSGDVTLPAGDTQTLEFSGFTPGEPVFVVIDGALSISLAAEGTFNANDAGQVKVVATFPESGKYPVQVFRGDSATGTPVVDSVLVVTAPPAPAPKPTATEQPTAEPTDAVTTAASDGGFDAAPWIWGGVAVVVVAGIITWVAVAAKRRNA